MKTGIVLLAAILTTCPVSRSEPYVLHCTGSKSIEIEALGNQAAKFDKHILVDETSRSVEFLLPDGIWYECGGLCQSRTTKSQLVVTEYYSDETWSGHSEVVIDLEALNFHEKSVGNSHSNAISQMIDTSFNVSALGTCKRIDIQKFPFREDRGKPAP